MRGTHSEHGCCELLVQESAQFRHARVSNHPRPATARVLVADDDADICDLLEHHLHKAGYEVQVVHDGPAVLAAVEQNVPDLLLLDVQMPRLTGVEVCRQLGADPRWCDMPVIFLTACADTQDVVRGFEAGGADYVRKPVIARELVARVASHLALARNRAAMRRRAERLEQLAREQGQRLGEVRLGQEQLLTDPASIPDLNLGVVFQPAGEAGGDFYEIARLGEDEVALFVADVAGHDLSMAFVTGALKALTASFLNEALSPVEAMIQLNASLGRFLAGGRFVSACYARYHRATRVVELVNAGHPYPILQAAGEPPALVPLVGDVLGAFDVVHFDTLQLAVKPGDRLFLYTDGLTEGIATECGRMGSALDGSTLLRSRLAETAGEPIARAVRLPVERLLTDCACGIEDDVVLLGIEF